jgi:hypothetical protein
VSRAALLVGVTLGCGRINFEPGEVVDGDSGVDAPEAPLCERFADALWCNDFDGGLLLGATLRGGATGAFAPGAGWLDTDGYAITSNPGVNGRLQVDLPSPLSSGVLHLGGRIFLEPGAPTQSYVVVAQAVEPSFEKISFDLSDLDRAQIVSTISAGSTKRAPPGSFPRGVWTCFELAITLDAGIGGLVELSLDGAELLRGSEGVPTAMNGFEVIEVGALSSASNVDPITIRFDNLIVRQGFIGCP